MLNDRILKAAKPKDKPYKIRDREGLYAYVHVSGSISFRYNYRLNGRYETLTLGKYGVITLAQARERLVDAKKLLEQGLSPARDKQTKKNATLLESTFEDWFEKYISEADFAESTRAARKDTYNRNISDEFGNRKLSEIKEDSIRDLCERIKRRGAPSQAVFTRDIFARVYQFAIRKGVKIENPAANIAPTSIAKFKSRERTLSEKELKVFLKYLENSDVYPACKKGLLLILLTLVRKSEMTNARWEEFDLENAVWTIPAERMKARRAHNVYLSRQALEILNYLKILSEDSPFVLQGRTTKHQAVAVSSLNRAIRKILQMARADNIALADFTVHDLRRTGSTMLHEKGFNSDWVEKALAHEQQGIRAVYNRAEYAEQRKEMLQSWADYIFSLRGS